MKQEFFGKITQKTIHKAKIPPSVCLVRRKDDRPDIVGVARDIEQFFPIGSLPGFLVEKKRVKEHTRIYGKRRPY
jgi:hypothetical protein